MAHSTFGGEPSGLAYPIRDMDLAVPLRLSSGDRGAGLFSKWGGMLRMGDGRVNGY
jgi:hypothetical protein